MASYLQCCGADTRIKPYAIGLMDIAEMICMSSWDSINYYYAKNVLQNNKCILVLIGKFNDVSLTPAK